MLDWRGPYSPDSLPAEIRRWNPRIYQADVEDGHLTVIVAEEAGVWHLSISHRRSVADPYTGAPAPGRLPTYDELKSARYTFCPPEVYMAQIFPPEEEFVNVHPTTLHLWQIPRDSSTTTTGEC